MIYKTEQELRGVISLGKTEEVIDIFLASYLQGLEFDKWKADKDLEATEEVVVGKDEDGNDIFETRVINIYQAVDVSEKMDNWKLYNYQLLRQPLYPNQSEYLDAVVKGDEVALQQYKDKCLAIKEKYPKARQ